MMKYLKRISWETYIILITFILKTVVDIINKWNYKEPYKEINHYFMLVVLIVTIIAIILELYKNRHLKVITGVLSGDYETECIDVDLESFKNYTGNSPMDYDKSHFYKDMYRLYRIPITEHMRKLGADKNLLKIKINDYGIVSVNKIRRKAIKLQPDEIEY